MPIFLKTSFFIIRLIINFIINAILHCGSEGLGSHTTIKWGNHDFNVCLLSSWCPFHSVIITSEHLQLWGDSFCHTWHGCAVPQPFWPGTSNRLSNQLGLGFYVQHLSPLNSCYLCHEISYPQRKLEPWKWVRSKPSLYHVVHWKPTLVCLVTLNSLQETQVLFL